MPKLGKCIRDLAAHQIFTRPLASNGRFGGDFFGFWWPSDCFARST